MSSDDNEEQDSLAAAFVKGKITSMSLPVVMIALATWVLKGEIDKQTSKMDPILTILIYAGFYFVMLLVSTLLYVIKLLIKELGKKSEYTADLEKEFLKRRSSAKKVKKEDKGE